MVGPSRSGDDREPGMSKLQFGVVALVAGSGALVSLYADASPLFVAVGAVAGAVLGFVLWRYMVWTYHDGSSKGEEREDTEYEKRERFK